MLIHTACVCSDTVSRVGVFCSLVNAIEMYKMEGVVDVFQVVKALRIQKPGVVLAVVRDLCVKLLIKSMFYVPLQNQYSFIFDVILTCLDTCS